MLASVILAAGKGTRMASDLPKVLHPLLGVPLLDYMLEKIEELECDPRVVVVGYQKDRVVKQFENRRVTWADQDQQLGTGHAAAVGVEKVGAAKDVLILNGDLPCLSISTLRDLLAVHADNDADLTILTCEKADPSGYGRIVRDPGTGRLTDIVEERDASEEVRRIREINVGVYVFRAETFRKYFARTGRDNAQNEYYLTDVVVGAARDGQRVETAAARGESEIVQVNSRSELATVGRQVRFEILERLMVHGVTIVDPETTFVEKGVRIGKDSVILPFTYIRSGVEIGPRSEVGPFTHLRPGTALAAGASIGNFVEIKASRIGVGSKVRHLTYIGDADVGDRVNVGAGTIVANYDGVRKNHTVVKDGAFIGSGTILVAPVSVGKESVTGAGAVVTRGKDVADGTVVVGVPARPLRSSSPGGAK